LPSLLDRDLLAELAGQVVHQARHAVEGETDRQHADAHDRFLQLAGVAIQFRQCLGELVQLAHVEILADLPEDVLGYDQLADHVDELIDLADVHADRGGFAGRGTGRCARFGGAGCRIAFRFRCRFGGRRRLGNARHRCRFRQSNAELALLAHPVERLVDGGLGRHAFQHQVPAEIAGFGIEPVEGRQLTEIRVDPERTVFAQFAEYAQRVVAGLEQMRLWAEADFPILCARCLGVGQGRRRRGIGRSGTGLQHVFQQCMHPVDARMIDGIFAAHRREHLAQDVDRLKQQVHRIQRYGATAISHFVQQGFEHVGELRHLTEPESAAAALDRMRGAENRVNGVGIHAAGLQVQQAGFHAVQALEALFEEGLMKLFEVDAHAGTP